MISRNLSAYTADPVRTVGARSFAKGPVALQRDILGEARSDVIVDLRALPALTSEKFAALAAASRLLAERGYVVYVTADDRYDRVLALANLPIIRM
jgi:hypothetical protein